MNLRTSKVMPSTEIPWRLAMMPMTVATQEASAVASRSVGENAWPRPLLSSGASVTSLLPEGVCSAEQCRSPSYSSLISTMMRGVRNGPA